MNKRFHESIHQSRAWVAVIAGLGVTAAAAPEAHADKARATQAVEGEIAIIEVERVKVLPDIHPFEMADLSSASSLSVDVSAVRIDGLPDAEGVGGFGDRIDVITTDIAGQVQLRPGLAIFAKLPVSHTNEAGRGGSGMKSDLGNVSAGVRYVHRMGRVRVGASLAGALPTAADIGSATRSAAVAAGLARFDRFADYAPDTASLYAQTQLRVDFRRAFVQALLGIERHAVGMDESRHRHVRTGLATGLRITDRFALLAEWTGLAYGLDRGDDGAFSENRDGTDGWMHLGGVLELGRVEIGSRVLLPMRTPLSRENSQAVGAATTLRVRF